MSNKLTLEEQRDNIKDAIWRATGRKDNDEVKRLEGHLIEIDKQIRGKHGKAD